MQRVGEYRNRTAPGRPGAANDSDENPQERNEPMKTWMYKLSRSLLVMIIASLVVTPFAGCIVEDRDRDHEHGHEHEHWEHDHWEADRP